MLSKASPSGWYKASARRGTLAAGIQALFCGRSQRHAYFKNAERLKSKKHKLYRYDKYDVTPARFGNFLNDSFAFGGGTPKRYRSEC